ncbi:MAG: hypothetical protein K9M97_07710 [Akkermansiaceae bacterium]|nr:hypothetical protein [Akkermansiaceae bacterium]
MPINIVVLFIVVFGLVVMLHLPSLHWKLCWLWTVIFMAGLSGFLILLRTFDVMSPRHCGEHELNLKCFWAVDIHDFAARKLLFKVGAHEGLKSGSETGRKGAAGKGGDGVKDRNTPADLDDSPAGSSQKNVGTSDSLLNNPRPREWHFSPLTKEIVRTL